MIIFEILLTLAILLGMLWLVRDNRRLNARRKAALARNAELYRDLYRMTAESDHHKSQRDDLIKVLKGRDGSAVGVVVDVATRIGHRITGALW